MNCCRNPNITLRPSATYKQFCMPHVFCALSIRKDLFVLRFVTASLSEFVLEKNPEKNTTPLQEQQVSVKIGPHIFNVGKSMIQTPSVADGLSVRQKTGFFYRRLYPPEPSL